MAVTFYTGPNSEPYLARVDSATLVPEVFWDDQGEWHRFPELDTLTEASPVSREQALRHPGMSDELLDAPITS